MGGRVTVGLDREVLSSLLSLLWAIQEGSWKKLPVPRSVAPEARLTARVKGNFSPMSPGRQLLKRKKGASPLVGLDPLPT